MGLTDLFTGPPRKPWGLKWRSSVPFITAVIGVGITTDVLVYSIIVPVVPFQLEHLKYHSISALTGWLLFAYSAGLVLSTIPIAVFAENTSSRRTPLIAGLLCFLAAQVLLMEAPNYPLMAIARVLQGISSSVVWVVGFALICDTALEHNVGTQLGFATTGLPIGFIAGAPVGGGLYSRFDIRGPFIFSEICTLVGLLFLLLIIERDVAVKWGYDPVTGQDVNVVTDLEAVSLDHRSSDAVGLSQQELISARRLSEHTKGAHDSHTPVADNLTATETSLIRKPLPILSVIRLVGKSPRALTVLIVVLVYATVTSMHEATLPLRLQAMWGYTSGKVGLVYIAGLAPSIVSSPLAGFLSDRMGPEYIAALCLLLALPWWIVISFSNSIVLFVVSLALQCLFISGICPSASAELAVVSRRIPGVGYAHVYGAYNLVFGVGTAVGPAIGGQVYATLNDGWTVLCYIIAVMLVLCAVPVVCFMGEDPMLSRMRRRLRLKAQPMDDVKAQASKKT